MDITFMEIVIMWNTIFAFGKEIRAETQRYFVDVTNCGERTDEACAEYYKNVVLKYCAGAENPICSHYAIQDYDCSYGKHGCASPTTCTTVPGGYECRCQDGYEFVDNNCTDIDECSTGDHRCSKQKRCRNLPGTYRCCIDTNCNNEEVIDRD